MEVTAYKSSTTPSLHDHYLKEEENPLVCLEAIGDWRPLDLVLKLCLSDGMLLTATPNVSRWQSFS
jgi:hypothetical protein